MGYMYRLYIDLYTKEGDTVYVYTCRGTRGERAFYGVQVKLKRIYVTKSEAAFIKLTTARYALSERCFIFDFIRRVHEKGNACLMRVALAPHYVVSVLLIHVFV